MTTEERRALLDRAITAYGAPAQMDMAVEEMAELTKALCKIKRAQAGCEVTAAIGNVIEEMTAYINRHVMGCSVAGDLTINGEICRSYDPIDLCFLELNELMMKRLIGSRKEDDPNGKG